MHLARQGRTARGGYPEVVFHTAYVESALGGTEKAPIHRRDTGKNRAPLLQDEIKCFVGLEPGLQRDGAAEGNSAVLDDALAEGVEERQCAQIRVRVGRVGFE